MRRTFLIPILPVLAFVLAGCDTPDPEARGPETPPILGVADGTITTRRDYTDAVEDSNRRNDERGARGDWSYVRPAVGPQQ